MLVGLGVQWGLVLIKEKEAASGFAATLYRQIPQEEKSVPCLVIPSSLYCLAELEDIRRLIQRSFEERRQQRQDSYECSFSALYTSACFFTVSHVLQGDWTSRPATSTS